MPDSGFGAALDAAIARSAAPPRTIGSELVCVTETGSTNDLARAAAIAGCADGAAFIADMQTAGRGRAGRAWFSSPGACVLLSVVLRPQIPAGALAALTMLGACAVAAAIDAISNLPCDLKWPNDVQIGGRKVAGVLVESSLLGDRLEYAVLGVGVNLNLDTRAFPEIRGTATSISAETGGRVDRATFTAELLGQLDRRYALLVGGSERELYEEWRRRLSTLGQRVLLVGADGSSTEVLADDVAPDGALLGRRLDGSALVVRLGDVTVRPPGTQA
jgi:BirA family biotin operon repressor/biotin-[acetyl-CoA-carboxylase] ligase